MLSKKYQSELYNSSSSEREKCAVCGEKTNNQYRYLRYASHICNDCIKVGVPAKMDDIFYYFLMHKKPSFSERRKFNILEKLAYNAFRAEATERAKKKEATIKENKRQNTIKNIVAEVDTKYTKTFVEEDRILKRSW